MSGPTFSTEAFVLQKHPPTESFHRLALFSAEHGSLAARQRIHKKTTAVTAVVADLFDLVSVTLEAGRQPTGLWFVKDLRLVTRHEGIGRDYEALLHASAFAALVARNPVPDESRESVHRLLGTAFAAFARSPRPDIVAFKSHYCFARDEGYPLKQHWIANLSATDRALAADLLQHPSDQHPSPPEAVATLSRRLEDFLRAHTEVLVD